MTDEKQPDKNPFDMSFTTAGAYQDIDNHFDSVVEDILQPSRFEGFSEDPVGFINSRLGLKLAPDQIRVAESVRDNRLTVVESGHGTGKSVVAAALVNWWMAAMDSKETKAITFAPTHNQVNNILWRYIRNYGRGADLPGVIMDTPRWEFGKKLAEKFAIGLSPKKTSESDMTSVQGYHSPRLLIILDECAGLPRIIWQAIETLQPTAVLAIGNPIEQSGAFWEAANSPRWNRINLSCLNHPNVVSGVSEIEGAVTRDWVGGMIDEHTRAAVPNEPNAIHIPWLDLWVIPDNRFKARVLGIAPTESPDQLISAVWVMQASNTVLSDEGETAISLDPARRGGDDFAIVVKRGGRVLRIDSRQPVAANPTEEIMGWFLGIAREFQAVKGYIDSGGMGAPIMDMLRETADFAIIEVNSSHRSPKDDCFNMRSHCWWQMRLAFQKGEIDLPPLLESIQDKLETDLTAPRYGYDSGGRKQIESKDKIKERIGKSPDVGDALSLHYMDAANTGDRLDPDLPNIGKQGGMGGESRWGQVGRRGGGSRWRIG